MERIRKEELLAHDDTFRYQLLDRMRGDCDYYLGAGGRNAKDLWAEDEAEHLATMRFLYESFLDDQKPEWLLLNDIKSYERQMLKEPQTLEERYTRAMALAGYERLDVPADSLATVSFGLWSDYNVSINVDGWEALGDVLESMKPLHEADQTEYEALIHPMGRIVYYTENLDGTGQGKDLEIVTYPDIKSALEEYLPADSDGKKVGIIINGEKQWLSYFDAVDMKNHFNSGLYPKLDENEKSEIREELSDMKLILDKDNIYIALKNGLEKVSLHCIVDVTRGNTEWGSWIGRVANSQRPQDYLDIDITGYSTQNQIICRLTAVHANDAVDEMQYAFKTDPEDWARSIYKGMVELTKTSDVFLHTAVDKLDTDTAYPMIFYSPHTSRGMEEHYRKLEDAGYDAFPENRQKRSEVSDTPVSPDELKDFVKGHYSSYSDVVCTEKIAEALSISINKMIDNHHMENTHEAIEAVLRKESTYEFVKSRQPNVLDIPLTVLHDVEKYFESSGGLNNYVVTKMCRASNDPGEDYLYAVVGNNVKTGEYACWTSWNQSKGSLNLGHYNLPDEQNALDIIKDRFNDISDEPSKFGMENTLKRINQSETAEKTLPKPTEQTAKIVQFNGRRGR